MLRNVIFPDRKVKHYKFVAGDFAFLSFTVIFMSAVRSFYV